MILKKYIKSMCTYLKIKTTLINTHNFNIYALKSVITICNADFYI